MRTSQASLLLGLLLVGTLAIACAQDVSVVLAQYPKYSKFSEFLKSTGVLTEVNSRSSMTILLPSDGALNAYVASHPSYTTQMVADVIRYHCLLQYFSIDDLKTLTGNNAVVTTLYQTTGRANDLDGFVNVTAVPGGSITVSPSTPGSPVQATIVTNVTQYPYNYSFMEISGVLEPIGLAAAQLAPTTPPTMAPVPAPASVPAMAPEMESPVMAPMMAPMEAPMESPVEAPVESPIETPVEAPSMETPVEAPTMETPVMAPPMPPMSEGPAANGPMGSPISSAFSVQFNFAAVVASVFVAALLF